MVNRSSGRDAAEPDPEGQQRGAGAEQPDVPADDRRERFVPPDRSPESDGSVEKQRENGGTGNRAPAVTVARADGRV